MQQRIHIFFNFIIIFFFILYCGFSVDAMPQLGTVVDKWVQFYDAMLATCHSLLNPIKIVNISTFYLLSFYCTHQGLKKNPNSGMIIMAFEVQSI